VEIFQRQKQLYISENTAIGYRLKAAIRFALRQIFFGLQRFSLQDFLFTDTARNFYRGELSYLAPLGSENISAPYFKQCFFQREGGVLPPDWVKHHASQFQDRNNKYFILYIEFCFNNKI